jgi:hypothetical protein
VNATLGTPGRGWRRALIVGVALSALIAAVAPGPLRQDPAYHDFADRRALLGVPSALNVLSNAGFLLVGTWALARRRQGTLPGWERLAVAAFGLALILTGVGSAWYHLAPSDRTLVWDRLPLSVLLPVVLAVVTGDRVGERAGRLLLAPLALGAVASVLWWHWTEDLRPYALGQLLPIGLIPLMLALLPGRRPAGRLAVGIALYALAKAAELADDGVFALGGIVSGHTLKHLLAAAAAVAIVAWLADRGRARGARP